MTTYKVTPNPTCKYCRGTDTVTEYHPWGNTTAAEELTCECVYDNLPEEFNSDWDKVEIEYPKGDYDGIIVRDSPEFEW